MQAYDAFYDEIYKKFHAPPYAGKNFNALWDILTDLIMDHEQKQVCCLFLKCRRITYQRKCLTGPSGNIRVRRQAMEPARASG